MSPVPSSGTRALLKTLVASWCHALHEIADPLAGNATLSTTVWARDNAGTSSPFRENFNPEPRLDELLSLDTHLKATCVNRFTLARAIEVNTVPEIVRWATAGIEDDSIVDTITDLLLSHLFEDDYKRRVYFRLYNLTLNDSTLTIEPLDGALQTLSDTDIPRLTGEVTPTSTLHRSNTGNVFLVFEDRQSENDIRWWQTLWEKAYLLVQVLMYLKYEVVNIDYSVIHFTPEWVNQVRRYGITLWGQPRWDVQATRYAMSKEEEQTLLRYLRVMQTLRPLLEDMTSTLRQATATAGDYYEAHYARLTSPEQLIA